jgi:hypothetical protein
MSAADSNQCDARHLQALHAQYLYVGVLHILFEQRRQCSRGSQLHYGNPKLSVKASDTLLYLLQYRTRGY